MSDPFKIEKGRNGVILSKDGVSFSVEKGSDGDIWFNSMNGNVNFLIGYTRDEVDSYYAFEYLMKLLIGRFVLSGDSEDEISFLPKDFIDLGNMIVTWHSDDDVDNILQLQYLKDKVMISIMKKNSTNYDKTLRVRIRTSGSMYEHYYKEFEKFYTELCQVDNREKVISRRLSL